MDEPPPIPRLLYQSPRRRQRSIEKTRTGNVRRRDADAGLTLDELLALHTAGKTPPLQVLDLILSRCNTQHTALEKSVSHKTRFERAQFLRRFFRHLREKARFRRIPDPRSLRQKHVRAMVSIWQQEKLASATIQTYLSFLRGLALWIRKPGLIRKPAFYGLGPTEYERHEVAQRDKSWTPKGIDVAAKLSEIGAYDARAGACLQLMHALGMRKKETLLFRPFADAAQFQEIAPPPVGRTDGLFVHIIGKGGRKRWVALDCQTMIEAVDHARRIAPTRDAHMGDPGLNLKQNLRRLAYVMEKFGITERDLGVTGHGLRHEHANDLYEARRGGPSPVRGGTPGAPDVERASRLAVARRVGHNRARSSSAYLGSAATARASGEDSLTEGGQPHLSLLCREGERPVRSS